MNTHIKTWLGTTIIIIMAITAGMFVWKYYRLSPISESMPQTIQTPKPKVKENNIGMANPASVFCEENGGKLEIITATNGSQSGMCKFSDGSQCEEWAFQRGECKIGDSQKQVDTSDWQTYRNDEYGFELTFNNAWKGYKVEKKEDGYYSYIFFTMPTFPFIKNEYKNVSDQMPIFNLVVIPKLKWEEMQKNGPPTPLFLDKNNKYVFCYKITSYDLPPEDMILLKNEEDRLQIQKVLSSFKFIN